MDFYSRHVVNSVLFFLHNCPLLIPLHNTAVLIKICRFLINVVKFTQTLTKLDLPTLIYIYIYMYVSVLRFPRFAALFLHIFTFSLDECARRKETSCVYVILNHCS